VRKGLIEDFLSSVKYLHVQQQPIPSTGSYENKISILLVLVASPHPQDLFWTDFKTLNASNKIKPCKV